MENNGSISLNLKKFRNELNFKCYPTYTFYTVLFFRYRHLFNTLWLSFSYCSWLFVCFTLSTWFIYVKLIFMPTEKNLYYKIGTISIKVDYLFFVQFFVLHLLQQNYYYYHHHYYYYRLWNGKGQKALTENAGIRGNPSCAYWFNSSSRGGRSAEHEFAVDKVPTCCCYCCSVADSWHFCTDPWIRTSD